MRIRIIAFAAVVSVLMSLAACAIAAGVPDPNNTPYVKRIVPAGNGLGIARITTTESSTDPAFDYRMVSAGAVSSAKAINSSTYQLFGAQVGFGRNGTITVNDLTAFRILFNPANPDVLTVQRNWIFTRGTGITDFGLGGISADGSVSIRVEGSGGRGVGKLDATWTGPPTAPSSYADEGCWTRLAGSPSCTDNMNPPGIGNDDNLQAFSIWSTPGFLAVGRPGLIPSGNACSNVACQNLGQAETRGGLVVSSAARKIAVLAKKSTDVSDQASLLRVYSYTDNGSSISATYVDYDFSNAIPGKVCSGTNFFSQTGFRGPEPLSINSHGDIAFPVVVVNPGFSGSWRVVPERAILMMEAANPGVFKVVCANYDGSASPVLFYDPTNYAPTFGGVAIDDSKNVFFSYTNWMGFWGGSTKSTNCVFRAVADDPVSPTSWKIEPAAWLGMTWRDPEEARVYEIALLYLFNTGVDYLANPAAFAHKNLNRTPILGESFGGFLISAGLGDDDPNTSGLIMSACYVAPTRGVPAVQTSLEAIIAPDGEPVNLINAVVLAQGADYVDSNGNIWSQYYVADKSFGAVRVSTIRSDLEPGDVIYASGQMRTDGDRFLASGGVVLVEKGRSRPVVGMNNRSAAELAAAGLPGRFWVKVWGRVSDLNTTTRTFKLDDGSGSPVTVDYSEADPFFAPPSNGSYYPVTGRITGALPTVVSVYRGDG